MVQRKILSAVKLFGMISYVLLHLLRPNFEVLGELVQRVHAGVVEARMRDNVGVLVGVLGTSVHPCEVVLANSFVDQLAHSRVLNRILPVPGVVVYPLRF